MIGTMYATALMKLKKNVIGVIPTCENMPSGRATRPGDIVKWKPIDREEYDQTVADVEAGKFQPRICEVSFALDEFEKDIDGYNRKLQEALYGH